MIKLYDSLRRFLRATLWPFILTFRDIGVRLSTLIPDSLNGVEFRRFWGNGSALTQVYFVMDSDEGIALRNRFRFEEASLGRGALETQAGNNVVDGAFAPQAAAMVAALFARHAPNVLLVVTDADSSAAPEATLISYGTSDSNCKTI